MTNLTATDLETLPDGAVVLDGDGEAWQRGPVNWYSTDDQRRSCEEMSREALLTLLHPVPEPDHSMCARLVPKERPFGDFKWELEHPNGARGSNIFGISDEAAREYGYAIDPEPTVVERAAKTLADQDGAGRSWKLYLPKARGLDDAGLLAPEVTR
jgi:hypothetical protein